MKMHLLSFCKPVNIYGPFLISLKFTTNVLRAKLAVFYLIITTYFKIILYTTYVFEDIFYSFMKLVLLDSPVKICQHY